jgi:hypothetical protein
MNGRRVSGLLLTAGIGAAVLAGCSTDAPSAMSTAGGAANQPAAAPGQVKADSPNTAPAPKQEQQVGQPGVDRKLIRTASLELDSRNVVKTTNGARQIATDLGGFAGQEEVRGDQATLTLHIPSNQFDKALERLGNLEPDGVKARSQTAEDVTEQLVDVESRIATQRTSVERVRALLARAQTVNEIVQIESEVTRREADLESLEKRREALNGQVALSKVTLKVSRSGPAPAAVVKGSGGFLGGLSGGWHAFLATGGVVLRVLGAVLPFLIVLGVPGWFALRWWRRRRPALAIGGGSETGP